MTTRIFILVTGRATDSGLTFALKELRPDECDEVVIDNDAGAHVTVLTDDPIIEHGIEWDRITCAGHDVSGFAYCRFADGITLFYSRSRSLSIAEGERV